MRSAARGGPRTEEAEARLGDIAARIDAAPCPAHGASFSVCAARCTASAGRLSEAYHDIAQSASVFELIGEGYQSALSHLALGTAGEPRGRALAGRTSVQARGVDIRIARRGARSPRNTEGRGRCCRRPNRQKPVVASIDADDAIVRRLVDAAAFPELLGHETAAAVRDTLDADCAVVFVAPPQGDLRLVAWTGGDADRARDDRDARGRPRRKEPGWVVSEQIGTRHRRPAIRRDPLTDGRSPTRFDRRLRMIAAIAAQGFDLCSARQRPAAPAEIVPRATASSRCCRGSCAPAPR